MRPAFLVIWVCSASVAMGGGPGRQTPGSDFDALVKEYDAAIEVSSKAYPDATSADPDWIKRHEGLPNWAYAPRSIAFAEVNPKDPKAASAALQVLQVLQMSWTRERSLFPHYLRARDILIRDHLLDEAVIAAFLSGLTFDAGNTEPYFRALLARSTDRDTLARSCMALVKCNQSRAGIAARPYFDHLDDHPERLKTGLLLNQRLDPDYIRYVRTADPIALSAEDEKLLEQIVDEFGDIPLLPRWAPAEARARRAGRTLAESAQASLFARRNLGVGKVAPEIEGQDVDGKPMRLSDYRGKVVMLVFWGTWCGPCMRFLPTEKALTERLEKQPFVLLGINSDRDREKLKSAIIAEEITWRSWFDGAASDGPIAKRWNVQSWPTIIVLDKEGVIRFRGLPHHASKALNDAVDSLLRETKP